MRRLATTFLLVFATWMALTYSLRLDSLLAGLAVSGIITAVCRHLLSRDTPKIILHPMRWAAFLGYIAFMAAVEARAHLDVLSRIVTGKVRPAIVEVPVGFRTSLGKTLFGNSITLTPGTLTISAGDPERFYVHTIGYRKGHDIGGRFLRHGKRVIG